MIKKTQSAKGQIKPNKKSESQNKKKLSLSTQRQKIAKKIAPQKKDSLAKKNLIKTTHASIVTTKKEFYQEPSLIKQTNTRSSFREKWHNLIRFLVAVLQGTWLICVSLWRLVKLTYLVIKFFVINLWRLTKIVVPFVVKGAFHLALELGKYTNIYLPKCWHFLKVNVPIFITWLEKEIPIFLSKLEVSLKKYTPIVIKWTEEKAIYFYNLSKTYLALFVEKMKILFSLFKKNYPGYKKEIIKYAKHGIALYKKHRPFAFKNIKS